MVMSPEKEKHRAKYQVEETKAPHKCLLVLVILLPVICIIKMQKKESYRRWKMNIALPYLKSNSLCQIAARQRPKAVGKGHSSLGWGLIIELN